MRDETEQQQHRYANQIQHHAGFQQLKGFFGFADHAPAHRADQPVGQQNIAVPQEDGVREAKQHQPRQPRADPAFAAPQQHLQPGTEQQCEHRRELRLREEIEQRQSGVARRRHAQIGRVEIGGLRQAERADVQQ